MTSRTEHELEVISDETNDDIDFPEIDELTEMMKLAAEKDKAESREFHSRIEDDDAVDAAINAFTPVYARALREIKRLRSKRPSTRSRPGEYAFPQRYFSNQQKRSYISQNRKPMDLLLAMRRKAESDCWNNEPFIKTVTEVSEEPSRVIEKTYWITNFTVAASYRDLGNLIGVSQNTAKRYMKWLANEGWLEPGKVMYESGGSKGRRIGIQYLLGQRSAGRRDSRNGVTWCEPEGWN